MDHNLITIIIRHLTILIGSQYCVFKLLNLKKPTKKQFSYFFIYYFLMAITIVMFKDVSPNYSAWVTLALILTSILFTKFVVNLDIALTVTTTIISYGFCYSIFFISSVLISTLMFFTNAPKEMFTFAMILASLTTYLLIGLPFKLKRLKRGMPFLKEKGGSMFGVIVSSIILSCIFILLTNKNALWINLTLLPLIPLSVILFFWWRSQIKKSYIKKIQSNELAHLKSTIENQLKEIEKLKADNEELAKIIHKDNKLIPAMELSVKSFLNIYKTETDFEKISTKACAILNNLEKEAGERKGILDNYQHSSKTMPEIGMESLDSVILYMSNKAKTMNMEFDLTLCGDITKITDDVMEETHLTTLISDLIENAIIATKHCVTRNILVNLGTDGSNYIIEVADSGIAFEIDTLVHLGTMKITTHKHQGGSGIGLFNAFNLFRKYNASFIIEEYNTANTGYTKKLTVCFNGKNQFTVKSPRAEKIRKSPYKNNIIVVDA